jgi:hypothetical protein
MRLLDNNPSFDARPADERRSRRFVRVVSSDSRTIRHPNARARVPDDEPDHQGQIAIGVRCHWRVDR